jgi:hypothetical protein
MYLKRNMPGVSYGLRLSGLRGARRSLGCATCGVRRLGQIENDPYYTGDYITNTAPTVNVDAPSLLVGPPAPTSAQVAYDQIVTSGSTPNPNYAFQPIATSSPTSTLPTAAQIAASIGIATVPTIGTPVGTPLTAASTSTLSAYLPYLVLGLGGIAFISVLKRR